jgi:CheY-like chemotaxis protein
MNAPSNTPATNAGPSIGCTELADLLVGLLEFRDPYFRGGSTLTRLVATLIGQELHLEEVELQALRMAAVLRDLGRISMEGELISQPAVELDSQTRRKVERHVEMTLELLEGIHLSPGVRSAIRHHHERWDGAGYPDRFRGEEIPLPARILAVADSFSAMIAARSYRPLKRISESIDELRREAGTRYDPQVIDALINVLARFDCSSTGFGLRHHILIVHPDQAGATILAIKLCLKGYLAEVASDLDAARSRLARFPSEALLVSAELDGSQPDDFLRELRQEPQWATLPVLALDAHSAERRVELLRAGADACFSAQVGFEELLATLGASLRRVVLMHQEKLHPTNRPNGNGATHSSIGKLPRVERFASYALQGNLQDFPLSWILQALKYEGSTAGIVISTDEEHGVITLEQGEPHHAETRSYTGEEALRAMLQWTDGSFAVRPGMKSSVRNVHSSTMHVLLDAAVVDDHGKHAIFGAVR